MALLWDNPMAETAIPPPAAADPVGFDAQAGHKDRLNTQVRVHWRQVP